MSEADSLRILAHRVWLFVWPPTSPPNPLSSRGEGESERAGGPAPHLVEQNLSQPSATLPDAGRARATSAARPIATYASGSLSRSMGREAGGEVRGPFTARREGASLCGRSRWACSRRDRRSPRLPRSAAAGRGRGGADATGGGTPSTRRH